MSENPMHGNPYAEKSAIQPHLTENDGFWGISQTIMALAYEQRTANLFALMQWARAQGDIEGSTELHNKIVERMGLRDE